MNMSGNRTTRVWPCLAPWQVVLFCALPFIANIVPYCFSHTDPNPQSLNAMSEHHRLDIDHPPDPAGQMLLKAR
ncbi:uncharacterized protein EDB93DRAFT_1164524, partial [Suillus bovinus]|uniref:uncharacterized protein n=1 Tax=Suillus bovinus TaxID=48563 RepID=UPI001B87676B